jgi:alkylation response protein AidB-like acyl-CoA dehydrogenase
VGNRLNGRKFYSTGSLYTDWIQVFASTPEGSNTGATIPVDGDGVTLKDDWDGCGERLTGTGSTILDNVYVKPERLLTTDNPTLSHQFGQAQSTQRESHCGRRDAFGSGDCPAYQIL